MKVQPDSQWCSRRVSVIDVLPEPLGPAKTISLGLFSGITVGACG
jgi:hypothetical protein